MVIKVFQALAVIQALQVTLDIPECLVTPVILVYLVQG